MSPSPIGDVTSWIQPDDYPPEAIRANRQGRVVAALQIDATGQITSCKIQTSSGTESLDAKACAILMERGRFNPATDKRGRAIASVYYFPVRWAMPDDAGNAAPLPVDIAQANFSLDYELTVGANGNVMACKVITRTDTPAESMPDPCVYWTPGKPTGRTYLSAGRPIAVVLRVSSASKATPVGPQ
ncbi:MAG: energy transducer TonB [Sphingomonas sp.]|uniref:energy transducer TonB n=1 Tax=Sphingomonas sp. TaxID=28214 RepID=UPI001AD20AA0|nr:energy transducer TonB [Sphingomonas sp.]MBN8809431.1 energy transducer TonB [Sphingomonas sp.]